MDHIDRAVRDEDRSGLQHVALLLADADRIGRVADLGALLDDSVAIPRRLPHAPSEYGIQKQAEQVE